MTHLAEQKCAACEGGAPALTPDKVAALRKELRPEWRIEQEKRLEREFKFKDFREALAFTNRVGELAEQEGHHPDIFLAWGKVKIILWSHTAGGLTQNDFVLAAKIDRL